jgi:alpha-glucosidase
MRHLRPAALAQVKDTFGTRYYQILRAKYGLSHTEAFDIAADYMGRDGCRTPMQWRNAPNGGFSPEGVTTWLPVNPDYAAGVNVEDQRAAPDSMLSFFRSLAALRLAHPALRRGALALVADSGPILAFWRVEADQRYLVALNLSATPQALGVAGARVQGVYASEQPLPNGPQTGINLAPYEIYVGQAERALAPSKG